MFMEYACVSFDVQHHQYTPTVPVAPADCTSTAVYNKSSGMLLSIDNTWDTVPVSHTTITVKRKLLLV